ncbi:MAG: hypothetical protein P8O79_10595 [Halieaceae bacterium]|nr:hypothetical protein [Halieaceae bacterium]
MTAGAFQNALATIRVAGAIAAMIIGAGIASGQELMQFFVSEGLYGFGGAFIFFILCAYSCVSLVNHGYKYQCDNPEQFFIRVAGPRVGQFFSWYSTLFLFTVYIVMIAGAAAIAQSALDLNVEIGAALMAGLVLSTVMFGLHSLIVAIGTLGPILVLILIAIAGITVVNNITEIAPGAAAVSGLSIASATSAWWLSGAIYLSFQFVGLASFLPAVGKSMNNSKVVTNGAILGSLFLLLVIVLICGALMSQIATLHTLEIPMLYLAEKISPSLTGVFGAVMIVSIYTTCAPALWMVLRKLVSDERSVKYKLVSAVVAVSGYIIAVSVPFSKLVNMIYPTVGYAGIILLLLMGKQQIKMRRIAG